MNMHGNFGIGWTDARVATLKDLALQGFSASQIAAALGGVSRNAVIGKMHRISTPFAERKKVSPEEKARRQRERRGKHGHQNVINRIAATRDRQAQTAAQRKQSQVEHSANAHCRRDQIALLDATELTDLPAEDASAAVSFDDLKDAMCHWPIGDPRSLDTVKFCGKPSNMRRPYCARHCGIAYRGFSCA